jgi:hypothetical protein
MNDTQKLLVDCVHGINAWHNLASRYPLYVQPKHNGPFETFETWLQNNSDIMEGATLQTVFHPDNEDYCENIEYMDKLNLSVQNDSGSYWRIEQSEGDIWAINPLAVWSDDLDAYELATDNS